MHLENMSSFEHASNGLVLKKAVDAVCDEFEDAWAAGKRPAIEDYLAGKSAADVPAYLRELVIVELALRRPGDPDSASEKYLVRFPEYQGVITDVFANWPADRVCDISIRLSNRYADLIQQVQERLQKPDPYKTDAGALPKANMAVSEAVRPTHELWGLLIRRAGIFPQNNGTEATHAQQVDRLEALTMRLLSAFPELRRELLCGLLLGSDIEEVANRNDITEQTVRKTYRAAVDMLTGR
jgi:hypothetical protein